MRRAEEYGNRMPSHLKVNAIDHIVATVRNSKRTRDFYARVLGMRVSACQETRGALHFGDQKLNLHEIQDEVAPKARRPHPGSLDICFVTAQSLSRWRRRFQALRIKIVDGPKPQEGARGIIDSIYIRDPDGNLIEIAKYRRLPRGRPPFQSANK